jgi:hypothetical protein
MGGHPHRGKFYRGLRLTGSLRILHAVVGHLPVGVNSLSIMPVRCRCRRIGCSKGSNTTICLAGRLDASGAPLVGQGLEHDNILMEARR